MTIESKVYDLLSAAGALPSYGSPPVELVPANRIKPPGDWQTLSRPYVVHFVIGTDTTYTHDAGLSALRDYAYQVSVFAESYVGARTIAEAVIAIMTGNHSSVQYFFRNMRHVPEEATHEAGIRVYHIALEFEAWAAV